MPSHQSFTITRSYDGDLTDLLAREADTARWPEWAGTPFDRFQWESPPPADLGEGAVRRLSVGPIPLVERTVSYVPGDHHTYSMDPSAGIRDYSATLSVSKDDVGRGVLTWKVDFDTTVPGSGPVLKLAMERTISLLANRLVAAGR